MMEAFHSLLIPKNHQRTCQYHVTGVLGKNWMCAQTAITLKRLKAKTHTFSLLNVESTCGKDELPVECAKHTRAIQTQMQNELCFMIHFFVNRKCRITLISIDRMYFEVRVCWFRHAFRFQVKTAKN